MGYTHYFKLKADLTNEVIADVTEVIKDYKEIIECEFDEVGRAISVNTERIVFNSKEYGLETFYLKNGEFSFCKTKRSNYDLPVCEVLLILKHHYGDEFELSSDGFFTGNCELSWIEAYNNVKEKFDLEDFEFVSE